MDSLDKKIHLQKTLLELPYEIDELSATNLANHVIMHPLFISGSGSSSEGKHHYGDGGLMQHTMEVVDLSLQNARQLNKLGHNIDLVDLYFAALFHDFGKTYDYRKDIETGEWGKTDHYYTHYHIFRSALEWNQAAATYGYPVENREAVSHAIVSHHGRPEWGSYRGPQTPLAWVLHLSDCMSARTNEFLPNDN